MSREFKSVDPSLISCTEPCDGEYAHSVEDTNIKQIPGVTSTKRCVAQGAYMRGQHHGGTQAEHLVKLTACRVCTIHTNIDNPKAQE